MKAEDPMAMMREAHRELSASYQQVAANKKPSARLCRWFCMKFVRLEVRTWILWSFTGRCGRTAKKKRQTAQSAACAFSATRRHVK